MNLKIIKLIVDKQQEINKIMQDNGAVEWKIFGPAIGQTNFRTLEQTSHVCFLITSGDYLNSRHMRKLMNAINEIFEDHVVKYYTPDYLPDCGEFTNDQQSSAIKGALDLDGLIQLLENESKKNLANSSQNKVPVDKFAPSLLNAISPKVASKTSNNNDYALQGELLEAFDELILGEFEMLADIKDEKTKTMLVDILFDTNLEASEVIIYADEIDPVFWNRFGILYCCMNSSKWNDPLMQGYKQVLLESYIKLSSSDSEQKDQTLMQNKEHWLKYHAKDLLSNFFNQSGIKKVNLPDEYQNEKNGILTAIRNMNLTPESIPEDVFSLEEQITEINKLIKEEAETINIHKKAAALMKRSFFDSEKFTKDAMRLTPSDPRWQEIYKLINQTPTGVTCSSEKMLDIVNAVLYKTFNNCRWRELPQYLPPEIIVRHYYYQWKSSGIFDQIMDLIIKTHNKSIEIYNLKPSM